MSTRSTPCPTLGSSGTSAFLNTATAPPPALRPLALPAVAELLQPPPPPLDTGVAEAGVAAAPPAPFAPLKPPPPPLLAGVGSRAPTLPSTAEVPAPPVEGSGGALSCELTLPAAEAWGTSVVGLGVSGPPTVSSSVAWDCGGGGLSWRLVQGC